MATAGRAGRLAAFAALVAGVGLAGLGFGATGASAHDGPHTGLFWLCNQGVRCNFAASLSSAPSNSVKWGRATGLSPNVTYDFLYTGGSHLALTDDACFSGPSSNIFTGGAGLLADSSGSIGGVTLTMPSAIGVHTKCVFPSGPDPTGLIASSRSLLTLT